MPALLRTPLRRRAAAAALAAACLLTPVAAQAAEPGLSPFLDRFTVLELQRAMDGRLVTAEGLTQGYLRRITELNPRLHAVVQVNPDALELAKASDARRRAHRSLGPLEGIPVLLKENVDTADRQRTTAGSTALLAARPARDAFLVRKLRAAGAVVLGKANMSEWANFRSPAATAGWSATGGQTRNPHVLDRSPCGSSSGSAAAAAAGLAAVTIGTDTDGSITCPASSASTVGVKPTLGLVSRGGVVPITGRHDSPGPITRTVTDAALTLWAIHGADPADPDSARDGRVLPADPRALLDRNALRGKRIGVWRAGHTGIDQESDRVFEVAVQRLRALGAVVVEGADLPSIEQVVQPHLLPALLSEFKHDLNAYLAATPGEHPKDLAGVIEHNKANAGTERLAEFGQDFLELAQQSAGDLADPAYRAHREAATGAARRAVDEVLARHRLDAIVTASNPPAPLLTEPGNPKWASATRHTSAAGYPHITVPAGFVHGALPLGLSFLGTKDSDARLLGFAYAFEQATHARRAPRYLDSFSG